MHLPSNVGKYETVPLPAFDNLQPRFILPSDARRLRAWSKAREVERRLDHFEWLAHVARKPQGIQSLVLDLATAYLLSFESALQGLQSEMFPNKRSAFEKWVAPLPANDLSFRGLRTMRHLEAHIRAGTLAQRATGGHSRFTGGEGGSNIGWQWSPVSLGDFLALQTPRISQAELPAWNRELENHLVMDLMRIGIERLISVFDEAEKSRS